MPFGLVVFVAWLAFMAVTTIAFILWAWREGQFTDEINYRMLIDHEPEPWPGREKDKEQQSGEINEGGG